MKRISNNNYFTKHFLCLVKFLDNLWISLIFPIGLWIWLVYIGMHGTSLIIWSILTLLIISLNIYNHIFNAQHEERMKKLYGQFYEEINFKKGLVVAMALLGIMMILAAIYSAMI